MKVICVPLLMLVFFGTSCTTSRHYMQRGQQAYDAGKYADASLNFRSAIRKDPKSGEAYYKLALAELQLNHIPEAYRDLAQAVEIMPQNQDANVALADICIDLYRADPRRSKALYDQAAKAVSNLAQKDPNGYHTHRLSGYLAVLDRRTANGIQELELANSVRPYQPQVVAPLMTALFENQRPEQAVKLGQETIQKHKDAAPIYTLLYGHFLASGQLALAENVLKTQIANNPKNADFVLQLAKHYAALHNDAQAQATVRMVLDHPTDFKEAFLRVGDYYSQSGNLSEAAKLLQQGAQQDPQDKLVYQKKLTNVLLAQDKPDEASRLVATIVQEQPNDPEALRLQAVLRMTSGKPEDVDKSVADLQKALEQAPNDTLTHFQLARGVLLKRDLDSAAKQLNEIIPRNPAFAPASLVLSEIAFDQHRPQEALTRLSPVLTSQPGNRRARLLNVLALAAAGRVAEARTNLNSLLRDEPTYVDARLELAFLDVQDNKLAEAEGVFRRLYQNRQAMPRSIEGLVQVLNARGDSQQAMHILEEAISTSPQPGALRLLFATTAAKVGRDDLVGSQLQQAVKENPSSYDAHLMLADYYHRKGDLNQAVRLLEKARQLAPQNPAPDISLAFIHAEEGQPAAAIESYRSALSRQPDNPVLLNDFAYYLAENGTNLDEALKMSQQAVQKLNSAPMASDTLGWIYLKKNMPDAALGIFHNLAKKDPNNALFEYHLGAALAAKGDHAAARSALQIALQKKPQKKDEAKIRELLAKLG